MSPTFVLGCVLAVLVMGAAIGTAIGVSNLIDFGRAHPDALWINHLGCRP